MLYTSLNDAYRYQMPANKKKMLDHLCSTLDEVKFPCGGATWTLDPQNFMKIRKNPENVCPGLRILLHHNAMC